MGKKSKKGQPRGNKSKHNKAGAGKSSTGTRTRTKSFDGSHASGDIHSVGSNDLAPQVKANSNGSSTPSDMRIEVKNQATTATAPAKKEDTNSASETPVVNQKPLEIPPPVEETETVPDDVVDKVIVKAAEDALQEAEDLLKEGKKLKEETVPVVEEKKAEPPVVEEKKAETVVEEKKPERVVEKPKEIQAPDPAPKPMVEKPQETPAPVPKPLVEKPKESSAPKAEEKATVKTDDPVKQNRGLALDEPAPEEAAAKQKDCECIIL